jgi:hypothetical protein
MRVEIFALCDAATDSHGKLNLLGTFDTLAAASFPSRHPHCSIALRLRFRSIEEGSHRVRLRFVDEDGQPVIPPLDGQLDVRCRPGADSASANLVLNLQSLPLNGPGRYSIDLAIDGREEASLPLYVVQAPSPERPAPAEPPRSSDT